MIFIISLLRSGASVGDAVRLLGHVFESGPVINLNTSIIISVP
jgi:hypothetical protein